MLLIRQLQGRMNVVNCMDFVLTSWWFVRRHSAFRSCMLRITYPSSCVRIMYGSRTDGRRKDQERKKKLFCVRGEKDGRANGNQSNLEIKLESLSNFDL